MEYDKETVNLTVTKKRSTKVNKVDFIGIGSAKSGSTWIAKALEEHPDILFSSQKSTKEIQFFNTAANGLYQKDWHSYYHKGLSWYFNQFPDYEPGKVVGEFCTSYFVDDEAPKNIYKHFPNTKLIVVLRNPVDMLYSLFWFCSITVEYTTPKTFEEFINTDGYFDRGRYFKHLKKYYDLFPRKNILVLLYDDIKSSPNSVLKELYTFLEVDPNFVPSTKEKVIAGACQQKSKGLHKILYLTIKVLKILGFKDIVSTHFVTNVLYPIYVKLNLKNQPYPKLDPEVRIKYLQKYQSDIIALEKLIQKDLRAWKC